MAGCAHGGGRSVMSNDIAKYTFLPWLRQGISTQITDTEGSAKNVEFEFKIELLDITETGNPISKKVKLYGPGDITGIDQRVIIRTDPKSNIGDFEPNYFPFIEFAEPDFPWRFTSKASAEGRLLPWLCLIVLKAEGEDKEFTELSIDPNKPLATLLGANTNALPNLADSWAWAHVQIFEEVAGDNLQEKMENVKTIWKDTPQKLISRILCPRKLEAGTAYSAFLVPTFKTGMMAGLGESVPDGTTGIDPAWSNSEDGTVILPVYYHWDFRTGRKGDFEYLVRQLKPLKVSDDEEKIGKRKMDVSDPGFGIPPVDHLLESKSKDDNSLLGLAIGQHQKSGGSGTGGLDYIFDGASASKKSEETEEDSENFLTKHCLELEGALVPTNFEPTSWKVPNNFQKELCNLLNLPENYIKSPDVIIKQFEQAEGGPFKGIKIRDRLGVIHKVKPPNIVTPPIYGRWHAAQKTVDCEDTKWIDRETKINQGWINQLNLDPRYRVVAALGTRVVQEQQEDLMASAWEQVDDIIEEVNQTLREAQLAREVSKRIFDRHFASLSDDAFLAITTPIHRRILHNMRTIFANLKVSRIPLAVTSAAFRRIARPSGVLLRNELSPRFSMERTLIGRLNEGSISTGLVTVVFEEGFDKPTTSIAVGRPALSGVAAQSPVIMKTTYVRSTTRTPGSQGTLRSNPVTMTTATQVKQEKVINPKFFSSVRLKKAGARPNFVLTTPGEIRRQVSLTTSREDSHDAKFFREAGGAVFDYINMCSTPNIETPPEEINLAEIKNTMLEELNPEKTIVAYIKQRLNLVEKYKRTDPLETVMAAPKFPQPMYEPLRDLSQDYLLPGVEFIPQNSITMLMTNQKFVEAYMVGLNHEMANELLWREYPTDQRGTYFRQFWDVRGSVSINGEDGLDYSEDNENLADIAEIHQWGKNRDLGDHQTRTYAKRKEDLVLLIRGDLLKKYPNTIIYAVPATSNGDTLTLGSDDQAKFPVFRGTLPPDITFLGFDGLTVDQAKSGGEGHGWFFVIQEQPGEPRFALDEATETTHDLNSWNDISWEHVNKLDNGFVDLSEGEQPSLSEDEDTPDEDKDVHWNSHAADMAYITYQRPVRIAVHAARMLP